MQWEGIFQYHGHERTANIKALAGEDAGGNNIPSRGAEVRTRMWPRRQMEILELGSLFRQEAQGRSSGGGAATSPSPLRISQPA